MDSYWASEDDLLKLVPLLVVKGGYILSVCYVEFRVHILEYVAAATVLTVMIMGSVEIMHGSVDNLVRYSRIGCAHVLSYLSVADEEHKKLTPGHKKMPLGRKTVTRGMKR